MLFKSATTRTLVAMTTAAMSVVMIEMTTKVVVVSLRLVNTPQGETAYLDADLRDTSAILSAAARTLDFKRPIALMLLIILIPDP